MGNRLARGMWIAVGTLLVLTAGFVFLSNRGAVARVDVIDVTRQNLSSSISSNGKVEPITPISFRAAFPTFVERILVVEGQQVKRGQLLFTLDDKSAQAELARARAELATQEDALSSAKAGGRADQGAKILADLQKAR